MQQPAGRDRIPAVQIFYLAFLCFLFTALCFPFFKLPFFSVIPLTLCLKRSRREYRHYKCKPVIGLRKGISGFKVALFYQSEFDAGRTFNVRCLCREMPDLSFLFILLSILPDSSKNLSTDFMLDIQKLISLYYPENVNVYINLMFM